MTKRSSYHCECPKGYRNSGSMGNWKECEKAQIFEVRKMVPHKRIWIDKGSGARKNGGFFTTTYGSTHKAGFKLLGDALCRGWSTARHGWALIMDLVETITEN